MTYTKPTHNASAFNCPRCGAYAAQAFGNLEASRTVGNMRYGTFSLDEFTASMCSHCIKPSVWRLENLLYPSSSTIPGPNPDTPLDIQTDYLEAQSILSASPRGAAALLRLALQKLCREVGEEGKNIDKDVAALVAKGLPVQIQQAMDTLRVVGNEAVHPGSLDLRDDAQLASSLFEIINMLVDRLISEPKRIAALYGKLPQAKRDGIDRRDARMSKLSGDST